MEGEMKGVIMDTDQEAASYRTDIEGWVSKRGVFFGDNENWARQDGATHTTCKTCGEVIKVRSYCRKCSERKKREKFHAMPKQAWNGTDGLYSQAFDEYYWDMDDIDMACEDHDCSIDDLMLIICVPIYAREIDPDDFYQDDLPEDGELPSELRKAFEELNDLIRESKLILSWSPGNFAAVI